MTETTAPGTDRLAKVRRYRRLFYGCILLGSAGLIVASHFEYHLFGVGVYWAGVLAAIAILRGTSVDLYDERDVSLERRASLLTLCVIGAVAVLGVPASVALSELGYFAMPPELLGAIYGYVALSAVFAIVYLWIRYRP